MNKGIPNGTRIIRTMVYISIGLLAVACTDEIIPIDTPANSTTERHFLLGYNNSFAPDPVYKTWDLTNTYGSTRYIGDAPDLLAYAHLAGIRVGRRQFLFAHNRPTGLQTTTFEYEIRTMEQDGALGEITEDGKWYNNYETVIGVSVKDRAFLFGQDSYDDHRWFMQEITGSGHLAETESDHGTWHYYYKTAIPMYVNGKTYIFFQTEDAKYWFISEVSDDGRLTDKCDGSWDRFWSATAFVQSGGKSYLVGHETCWGYNTNSSEGDVAWAIYRINDDGTMGPMTDQGSWANFYPSLCGYSLGDQGYIFGHNQDDGFWFIQQITAEGKLGVETDHGNMSTHYRYFYVFNEFDPGSLRYTIGWDYSATATNPIGSWSSLFIDAWSAQTEPGGGAALANIDGDSGGKLDAVLMGIQEIAGSDRYYYKVAWNLGSTGQAAGWSKAYFGPVMGETHAGGGADIADIDGNGRPDLLLMSVDDPEGANSFRYHIGWNLGTDGQVSSWGDMIQVNGLGDSNSGGGAALGFIDKNDRPELVLMGVDNPEGDNSIWYMIGSNLDIQGKAAGWTGKITAPCDTGWDTDGAGAVLADMNGNGKPDLLLMCIDSPAGANAFWWYIGWDINMKGEVTGWTKTLKGPSPGNITGGGGLAAGDINQNGIPDILMMSVDDPYGKE